MTEKNKGGRPRATGKFPSEEELVAVIRRHRAAGLYDAYIGQQVGVSKSKVRSLRIKHNIT